jgi:hypothetical protein
MNVSGSWRVQGCVLKLQDEKDPEGLRKAALILERENERLLQTVLELQRKVLVLQGNGDDPQQPRLRLAELEQPEIGPPCSARCREVIGAALRAIAQRRSARAWDHTPGE